MSIMQKAFKGFGSLTPIVIMAFPGVGQDELHARAAEFGMIPMSVTRNSTTVLPQEQLDDGLIPLFNIEASDFPEEMFLIDCVDCIKRHIHYYKDKSTIVMVVPLDLELGKALKEAGIVSMTVYPHDGQKLQYLDYYSRRYGVEYARKMSEDWDDLIELCRSEKRLLMSIPHGPGEMYRLFEGLRELVHNRKQLETDLNQMKKVSKNDVGRITPAHVDAAIDSVYFYTAADGLRGAGIDPTGLDGEMVMHCLITLKSGFQITDSAIAGCVDSHDRERGEAAALGKAKAQVYSYLYHQQMAELSQR